ncbi:unnamed protein product [Closterium sp. Naga37s-1]|nr:unnamed protein product [Closterium sp. Naga37s-1]
MPPKKLTKVVPKSNLELSDSQKATETSPRPKEPADDVLLTPRQPATECSEPLVGNSSQPSLLERLSALKVNGLKDDKGKLPVDDEAAVHSPRLASSSRSHEDELPDEPVMEDEDEGYLSDDPDEGADPESLSIVASKLKHTLTLLVPFRHESEVPRTADSVAAHLDHWKDDISKEAQTTTKFQKLTPMYLSKTHFGRLQVVFTSEDDAYYVRQRKVEHVTLKGETLELRWQFPEDATYIQLQALHPQAIEVVLKGVSAEVTPDVDACEKAHGSSFEIVAAHVASFRHKTNRTKAGAATRASKGALGVAALKKEFLK